MRWLVSELDDRDKKILDDVAAGTPYNEITKKHRVSPKTISALKKRHKARQIESDLGPIAAQAFALFNKHSDPDKVVIKLTQPPKVIKELYSNWVEMKGALLLPKSDVDTIFSKLDSLGDKLPRTSETLKTVVGRIPWIRCAWCGHDILLSQEEYKVSPDGRIVHKPHCP